MYWIYLAMFTFAILVPDIVPENKTLFFLKEEQLEELSIFLLGFVAFLIFRFKENQLNKNLEEKNSIRKEAYMISKNLNNSYSYIGETNRKLEIIKNISTNLLDISNFDSRKEKKIIDDIMESVFILGKSKKFVIRFIELESKKTQKETKSKKGLLLKVSNEEIVEDIYKKKLGFIEKKYHFITVSPKEINGVISAIIISKNNQQQKMEDTEIMKSLSAFSLFLYYYSKNNEKNQVAGKNR